MHSVEDFEAELLDDRIRQNVLRDLLHFLFRRFATRAVELQYEELPLAHILYIGVPQGSKGALNRLPLRIENRRFEHHPNVSFHGCPCSDGLYQRHRSCRRPKLLQVGLLLWRGKKCRMETSLGERNQL